MNSLNMIGRLVADPIGKLTSTGKAYALFRIAVKKPFKTDEVDFFTVIAWNKQADAICQYFTKGKQIGISGRLENNHYTDSNGNKQYAERIVMEHFDFTSGSNNEVKQTSEPITESKPLVIDDDFSLMADDDELPF